MDESANDHVGRLVEFQVVLEEIHCLKDRDLDILKPAAHSRGLRAPQLPRGLDLCAHEIAKGIPAPSGIVDEIDDDGDRSCGRGPIFIRGGNGERTIVSRGVKLKPRHCRRSDTTAHRACRDGSVGNKYPLLPDAETVFHRCFRSPLGIDVPRGPVPHATRGIGRDESDADHGRDDRDHDQGGDESASSPASMWCQV